MNYRLTCKLLLLTAALVFGQSEETGSAFNKYMAPEDGVNPLSGTVAFSKPLATISAGQAQSSFVLNYSSNITQQIKNRNDIAPTGWVGLGFSMGFAKIVSDNAQSMGLYDDTYTIITAEGARHKIIYDSTQATKKWWIENLPFWKIERKIDSKTVTGFDIVVGWVITDDKGIKYEYGDGSYCKSNADATCSMQQATQYELAYPKYGHVGKSIGGEDIPYPYAWNLAKQIDLEGNYLSYYYDQELEGVKVASEYRMDSAIKNYNWASKNKYTKECYLSKVESSQGSKVVFELKAKGNRGDGFADEYLYVTGKNEPLNSSKIDPIERKFLSKISTYGMAGKVLGHIDFCYKPLSFSYTNNQVKNQKYVKRLLTSLIWTNSEAQETDREDYIYNENAAQIETNPVGMITAIRNPSCGLVEFKYKKHSTYQGVASEMYTQELDVVSAAMGYYDNGRPYLVGLRPSSQKIVIYSWTNGRWMEQQTLEVDRYDTNGFFSIGENNWFLYHAVKMESTGSKVKDVFFGKDEIHYGYPIVWDGKGWVVQDLITSPKNTLVGVGLNYVVYISVSSDNKMKISLPWTQWGQKYEHEDKHNADPGSYDISFYRLYPTKNHIGLFYIGPDLANNGRLSIFTFKHEKKGVALERTYFNDDLDDDRDYRWGENYLFGAVEGKGLWGQYVEALHWNDGVWIKMLDKRLNGVQDVPTVRHAGDNFFAVRHNDKDDLSLFDWNGENWSTEYENQNMVFHDDFDLFVEAEWNASGGSNYFVARRPLLEERLNIPYPKTKFYKWGLKIKKGKLNAYSSTYNQALLEVFQRQDGNWNRYGVYNPSGNTSAKDVLAGNNWFIEKSSNEAKIWDGLKWNTEKVDGIDWLKFDDIANGSFWNLLLGANAFVLGDFIAVDNKKSNKKSTKIYYKKNDSFIKKPDPYFVSEKSVYDPIENTRVTYNYNFVIDSAEKYGFDYINNTPLVKTFQITLPNGGGVIHKTLCDPHGHLNLGLGQVCSEQVITNNIVEKRVSREFERIRVSDWPKTIYYDAVATEFSEVKGVKTATKTQYDSSTGFSQKIMYYEGDQVAKISQGNAQASMETNFLYAFEQADEVGKVLKSANRLTEVSLQYACKPNCINGKIVQANAVEYLQIAGSSIPMVSKQYSYNPKNIRATAQQFATLKNNLKTQSSGVNGLSTYFKPIQTVLKYTDGKVSESQDELGIVSAVLYDSSLAGYARATITNASLSEVLLVPGDTTVYATPNNATYATINLQGFAPEAKRDSLVDYGRFSNVAIDLTQPFEGAVRSSRGGAYQFSVWLQKTSPTAKVGLSINNKNAITWELHGEVGSWQYYQWEGTVAPGSVALKLASTAGSVRAQDVRFVPATASVTVSFFDKHWSKPNVIVSDRGVGAYSVLDNNGRVVRVYSEDNTGKLFLTSESEYKYGTCKTNASGTGKLKQLVINGNVVPLPKPGVMPLITLAGTVNQIYADWKPEQKGDQVRYRMYPEGVNSVAWESSCCTEFEGLNKEIGRSSTWILDIDVEPFESNVYKIKLQKSPVGWVSHGNIAAAGENPIFAGRSNIDNIYFTTKNDLKSMQKSGDSWTNKNYANGRYANVQSIGPKWLLATPNSALAQNTAEINPVVFYETSTSLQKTDLISNDAILDKFSKGVLDRNNAPNLIYQTKLTDNTSALKSAIYLSNQWHEVGASAIYKNNFTQEPLLMPGIVAAGRVGAADMVLGPNNEIYVAYVGSNPLFETPEYKALLPDSITGKDSIVYPKMLHIKKLYSPNAIPLSNPHNLAVWAGPSTTKDDNDWMPNFFGDVLTINEEPITSISRVKLARDGEKLYIAILHTADNASQNGMQSALSVFKGEFIETTENFDGEITQIKKLNFTALKDISVTQPLLGNDLEQEQGVVAYLADNSVFDFWVDNGVPYILFSNQQNHDALTLLNYKANRWLSVGAPAFALGVNKKDAASFSIANNVPAVVFQESTNSMQYSDKGDIIPLKYVKQYNGVTDKDLTLSSIHELTQKTSISQEFRQYILNYSATIDASVASIVLQISPLTKADVREIHVYNNSIPIATLANGASQVTIPLQEGRNNIDISVHGVNGAILTYSIRIDKAYSPLTLGGLVDILPGSPMVLIKQDTTLNGQSKKTIKQWYKIWGSGKTRTVCLGIAPGFILYWKDQTYYRNICLDLDFSNTSIDTLTIKDIDGNQQIIYITIDEIPDATTTPPNNDGGGSDNGDGNDNGDDNGGGEGDQPDPGTGIPNEYLNIQGFKLFTTGSLALQDRVQVEGGKIQTHSVEVGANAKVKGRVYVVTNAQLRSNSQTDTLTVGGSVNTQHGASYGKLYNTPVNSYGLPALSFAVGTQNVVVPNNKTQTIAPGAYKKVQIYANATVTFTAGTYYLESLQIEPDTKLIFDNSAGPIQILSQGVISFADRVAANKLQPDKGVLLYSNSSQDLYVGVTTALEAIFVAPQATVNMAPRAQWAGSIWAKSINIQPDALIK